MAVTDISSGGVNVIVCTAAADSYTAPNDRRIKITGIRWVGVSTAANEQLVIQIAGSTVFEDYTGASAAGVGFAKESKIFKELSYVGAFTIQTLGAGKVYLYYE